MTGAPSVDHGADIVSDDEQPPVDGMDIHREIPMPHWMNNRSGCSGRYLDDQGRIVKDESDYDDGQFAITLNRMHSLEDGQVYTSDDNADVRWISKWEDQSGVDSERFTILAKDIPELIGVLQRLHERFTPPDTKQLRRAAEVEEALREREF